jgi:hypothetical protein
MEPNCSQFTVLLAGAVRKFLAVALFLLLAQIAVWPCTIVSGVAANGVVRAGNNEDFIFDFGTYLNVLPPDGGKFSAMFFTYGGPPNFPQGGMNEKGLFFDLNAIPRVQRDDYWDYGKRNVFPGDTALLLYMLQTSLEQFSFDDLFEGQLYLAEGVVRPQQRNLQVSTNFNLARQLNAPEGQACWRFPIAIAFWDRRS